MAQEAANNRTKASKVKIPSTASEVIATAPGNERPTHKSWRAPAIMFATLLAGLGAALGHHFMNVSLNGKQVDQAGLSQGWASRFSTALAFLVQCFFTTSVGTAFVQRQWLNFHREPYKIEEIDSLTGILGNIFDFFTGLVWLRNPILTTIAIVSWTTPFAAVVAPGSLLAQPMSYLNTTDIQVPQVSFNSNAYAQIGPNGYNYPSDLVYQIVYAAAMSAQPLALRSAYQNQTYHLSFFGPAIRCGSAKSSVIEAVSTTLAETNNPSLSVIFVSWVGGNDHSLLDPNKSTQDGWLTTGPWNSYYKAQDQNSSDAARVFVMTNMAGRWGGTQVQVAECLLHNATYSVEFTFQYPHQTIKPLISRYLNPISQTDLDDVVDAVGNATGSAIYSYTAIMEAFGKLLVGASIYGSDTGYTPQTVFSSYSYLRINWNETNNIPRDLEQLFQNVTLSMLSNDTLTKDSTQADYIPVDATTYPNTFVYEPRDLLIAYGLSLFCTIVCSLIGLHAFHVNNASYQNAFSTFLRVTGHQELHSLTSYDDTGADPVPKRLAKARIIMQGGQGDGESGDQGGQA